MVDTVFFLTGAVLFVAIMFMVYAFIHELVKQHYLERIRDIAVSVNQEYRGKSVSMLKSRKKLKTKKRRGIFYKTEVLINSSGVRNIGLLKFLNPQLVLIICVCSSLLGVVLFEKLSRLFSVGLIMGIPSFFIPLIILELLRDRKEAFMERVLGDFLLQLKNNTKIHNDIIEAFRNVQNSCIEPLSVLTKQFLAEINSGISVETALDNFKDKVGIQKFKLLLTNIRHCYIFGGDFTELLDKTQKFIADIQQEKKQRIRETRAARIVLFILILLDLHIYFNFIGTQPNYINIMKTTFYGQLILNINFISIWFVMWLAYLVKKLDY